MGFVLARDIVSRRKHPRELCGGCVLIVEFEDAHRAGVAHSAERNVANVEAAGS